MILEAVTDIDFNVSWSLIIQTLVAVILPLLVGLVTKVTTPGAVKALLLAALNLISTGLTELLFAMNTDADFDLGNWLVSAIASFATSAAVYYGFWKPTGAAGAVQAIGSKPEPPAELPEAA